MNACGVPAQQSASRLAFQKSIGSIVANSAFAERGVLSPPLLPQSGYTDLKWTNLTESSNGQVAGFVDWDWAQTGCLKTGNCSGMGLPDTSIFATMYAKPGDWDTSWDPDVHLVRSDDFFKTIKKRVPCGNQFELMGRQVRWGGGGRRQAGAVGRWQGWGWGGG
jgi:hypothetical protein